MLKTKMVCSPTDKYDIEILRKEVFHLNKISPFYMQQLLDRKEYAVATVDDNNKIVAGCYFHRLENILMIDQLFVKEDYQNTGYKLGRGLVNNLLNEHVNVSELLGNKLEICRVESNNEKAKALYKKIGFRESRINPGTFIKPII